MGRRSSTGKKRGSDEGGAVDADETGQAAQNDEDDNDKRNDGNK